MNRFLLRLWFVHVAREIRQEWECIWAARTYGTRRASVRRDTRDKTCQRSDRSHHQEICSHYPYITLNESMNMMISTAPLVIIIIIIKTIYILFVKLWRVNTKSRNVFVWLLVKESTFIVFMYIYLFNVSTNKVRPFLYLFHEREKCVHAEH